MVIRSAEPFGMDAYADCLAGFIEGSASTSRTCAGCRSAARSRSRFHRRHPAVPRTLILGSAYAGWAGSPTAPRRGRSPRSGRACCGSIRRGFRAMASASAEDLRDVLPRIEIPALLVYGARDVRAPLAIAHDLHAAISGSRLVVLPDAGHPSNIEAAEAFNSAVRSFLRDA